MAEGAAAALNEILRELIMKSARGSGWVDHFFDIGIFGYGVRPVSGGEGVESAFGGNLQGQPLISLPAIAASPFAVQQVSSTDPVVPASRLPVWVQPASGYRTPMCEAMAVAGQHVYEWTVSHPESFPPIIINITDGLVTDSPYEGADLDEWAKRLTSIQTTDGPALLFNIFLSPDHGNRTLFPASAHGLSEPGPELFRISSILPPPMITSALSKGIAVPAGARGFGFNADLPLLDMFMEITLRPSVEIGTRETPRPGWYQINEHRDWPASSSGQSPRRAPTGGRPPITGAQPAAPGLAVNRPAGPTWAHKSGRTAGSLAARAVGVVVAPVVAGALAAGARAAEALAAGGSALSRGKPGNQDLHAGQSDDPISRAVRSSIRTGLLAFNPPAEMNQGTKERVEVGVARSPELREALATGLRGRGEAQLETIPTSAHMGVELKGPSFEIIPFSDLEQLVAPTARWEFDVRPYRAGLQTLTLCVSLRIEPGHSAKAVGGRIAIPILEREIRIRVDVGYGTRRFIANNWQWLIATILGLGGAIAAWVTLIH